MPEFLANDVALVALAILAHALILGGFALYVWHRDRREERFRRDYATGRRRHRSFRRRF